MVISSYHKCLQEVEKKKALELLPLLLSASLHQLCNSSLLCCLCLGHLPLDHAVKLH